jgi:TetR/AcrR family transcriptional regulator, fatty acid metabolism regulator protein
MSTTTPPRSLKERQREEREQLILQAGEALIAEKGYSDTSMDDIAARVGVSKGTLYLHFARKEDLILAVIESNLRAFGASMNTVIDSDVSPRAKLEGLLRLVYLGSSDERIRLMESLLRVPELRIRMMDQKKETITAFWGTFAERLAAVIAEAQATGELDPAIPTPVLQAIFTGLLHPANFSGSLLATERPIPREELIGYLSQFFFRGAAATEPHQEGKGRLNEHD